LQAIRLRFSEVHGSPIPGDGDDAKAMAAGCDAYVTKPIFVDELLATIARVLA